MKNIIAALILTLGANSAFACQNLGRLLERFEYYVGSETQKEYARDQARAYARKHGGTVVERMAVYLVYSCEN